MTNCSDSNAQVAYVIDTFPRRSENFIMREISQVAKHMPNAVVLCLNYRREDWRYVDASRPAADLRVAVARSAGLLSPHLSDGFASPLGYARALVLAWRLYGFHLLLLLRRFHQAAQIASLAKRHSVRHFHAHFATTPGELALLASSILAGTYSLSVHANDIWATRPRRAVIEKACFCACCTQAGLEHLSGLFPRARLHLIRHGLDTSDIAGQDTETQTVRPPTPPVRLIAAGRFVPKKGFRYLVDACAILQAQRVDFLCDIYGEGPEGISLARRIDARNLRECARLNPFVPHADLHRALLRSHICVVPSCADPETGDRDGLPNVVLEAAAARTVLVVTDLPSIREFAIPGQTAYVCVSSDAHALAKSIMEAIETLHDWDRMRRSAKKRLMHQWSLPDNAKLMVHLFRACLGISEDDA